VAKTKPMKMRPGVAGYVFNIT